MSTPHPQQSPSTTDVDALFTQGRTFCALPWRQVFASIEGIFTRCCLDQTPYTGAFNLPAGSPMPLNPGTLGCLKTSPYAKDNPDKVTTLAAVFNSPEMRATRAAMLSDQRVAACRLCYSQEREVGTSMRVYANSAYRDKQDWKDLIRRTGPDGHLDAKPIELDLRLGNHCNLTCEMCSYPVSSSWLKFTTLGHKTAIIDPYRHDAEFWDNVRDLAPGLTRIYLAGGEPFIQAGHYHLLNMLVEMGESHHIELVYTSNLTVLPRKAFDLWPKFSRVEVVASCDGVGEVYEKIRRGARWNVFAHNVIEVSKQTPTKLTVTVQKDNLLVLGDLLEWAHAHSLGVELTNFLIWPEPMHVKTLGRASIEECRRRYLQMAASFRQRNDPRLALNIEACCAGLAEICNGQIPP